LIASPPSPKTPPNSPCTLAKTAAVKVESDIHYAAKLYAAAIAELWWVILQALIMYLLKRAGEMGGAVAGKTLSAAMKTEKRHSPSRSFSDFL
jgi:hypothetical protein